MYEVDTRGEAAVHIKALPAEALVAFAEAMVVLEIAPWNGYSVNNKNPDAPLRHLIFASFGIITYLIVDRQRLVSVIKVQWAG